MEKNLARIVPKKIAAVPVNSVKWRLEGIIKCIEYKAYDLAHSSLGDAITWLEEVEKKANDQQ